MGILYLLLLRKLPGARKAQWVSDSLLAGRYGGRNSVEARFSPPVQTGPAVHPAYYTMGTGYFPGVNWPGRGVDHPPHLAPRLRRE